MTDPCYITIVKIPCSGKPYTDSGFRYCLQARNAEQELAESVVYSRQSDWAHLNAIENVLMDECLKASETGVLDIGRIDSLFDKKV